MRIPRFNLRVALTVTTLVAVLAWQANIVRQRKMAMQSGRTFILARPTPDAPNADLPAINPLRSLLGDEPVRFAYVVPEGDWERDLARLKRLFPEAKVEVGYPPFDEP